MRRFKWHITLGVGLVVVSALCYIVEILIFHRPADTFFYMLQDFAFVPVQVLLVTIVISELLHIREKNALRHKMNMVIGAFFSEVGLQTLKAFSRFEASPEVVADIARVQANWVDKDFAAAGLALTRREYSLDCRRSDLQALKDLMIAHRQFLLQLLANPNLMEHESFTELLWAMTHLAEELSYRESLDNLPDSDLDHLAADIKRAYVLLLKEWLAYAKHLRDAYPFVFSLMVRTSPFDPDASPIVR